MRRGLQLMLPPSDEIGIAVDVDDERHLGVLNSAIFGALAAVDADLLGHEDDIVLPAGDEVLLAGEARHPEAVDHVVRVEPDPDRHAYRQVQFVGGGDAEIRVAELPPPLMPDHLDP